MLSIIRTRGQCNIHLQEQKVGGRNKNLGYILTLDRISLAFLSGFIMLGEIYIIPSVRKVYPVWYNVKFKEYYRINMHVMYINIHIAHTLTLTCV